MSITVNSSASNTITITASASSTTTVLGKGVKGDKGDTGDTGATGATGPAGADGTSPNAFTTIAVAGQDNVVADGTSDTLTIAGGSNVTVTTNASSDTVTIASTDTNTQLSTEEVQDIVGAMFTGNTETRIAATYEDSDGTIDLVVDAIPVDLTSDGAGTIHANNVPTLNQNTSGTAAGLSSTLAVGSGGTGATSLTDNSLLTGTGTSAITAESNLTFDGSILTITGQRKTPNPASDGYHGDIVAFGSGPSGNDDNIVDGKVYYLDSSQQWEETDPNAVASSTRMHGIATDNDTARFLVKGFARDTAYAGFTTGDVLYLSASSNGAITNTAPTASGDVVRIVGYVTNASIREIYFDPSKEWIEL